MNHAFEITEDGVMKITIPEDKEVFLVVVRSPGYTKVFSYNFKIKAMLIQAIAEYRMKIRQETINENKHKC